MKQKLLACRSPIGIFAFTESGELVNYTLFDKKPETAAGQFEKENMDSMDFEISEGGCAFLRKNFREYAVSLGFAGSNKELTEFLSMFAEIMSMKKMSVAIGRDRLVIQASNALEDVIRMHNLLSERLREWYMLHYPEMKKTDIAGLVASRGRRENMPGFRGSTGAEITENDEAALKAFAETTIKVENQRKNLEKYIQSAMKEISPNLSSLVDPLLAARFLAIAGSLEKLAKMPSSTIQLLGAEKALFRHIRNQGKSPKFGIIFLDTRVQNAANKGKAARIIASKLMLAARIDFYSKRDESEKLRKDLKEELERL